MKQTICFLFLGILYLNTQAQGINNGNPVTPMYLDSAKEAYSYYLNLNDIDSLDIKKGYDSTTKLNGKVYFTTRKKIHFITLDSIAASKQITPGMPILYFIDHQLVKSPALVRIDSSFIKYTWITKATEIENLKNTVPDLIILYIETGNRDTNAPTKLILRGTPDTVNR